MRLLFGAGDVVRILASAGLLVVAAIGSGASETMEILGGLQLTSAHRVLAAFVLFSAVTVFDSLALRRKLTDHSSSPRLTWSNPQAEINANGAIHLEVLCENTGPTESVAILRDGEAWSGPHRFTIPITPGSPINSSKINQQAHRWRVDIDSPPNVQFSNGTHLIGWRVIYFDNARPNTHGYLTEETLSITFVTRPGQGTIDKPYFLDMTSTNEDRFKRYWKFVTPQRTWRHWIDARLTRGAP